MSAALSSLKPALYEMALSDSFRSELEQAHQVWQPNQDDWTDFIDMLAISWVDANGFTLMERELGGIARVEHRAWHIGQRAGVFVIDARNEHTLTARDADTEESLQLQISADLPQGSVIQGRLLPVGPGTWAPTGQPDVFPAMGVIQRMDLLQAWLEGPRAELLQRQDALRKAFLIQREQRVAFLDFFGTDFLVFEDMDDAQGKLDSFFQYLLDEYKPTSLGGNTYSDEFRGKGLDLPSEHRLELDVSLRKCSSLGVIFDSVEGIHFLPDFAQFQRDIEGDSEVTGLVISYLEEPGISALPFVRTDSLGTLRQFTGKEDATRDSLLESLKPAPTRLSPSLLPGPGE